MNLIQFGGHALFYRKELHLGDNLEVTIGNKKYLNCRFIKVTRKGFNILNMDTDRVLLKNHLYGKGMGKKEYPKSGPISVKVLLSQWVRVDVKSLLGNNVG